MNRIGIDADDQPTSCHVDGISVAALALVLMPLLTMAHELGGHAAACVLTHGRLTAVSAFYVDCDSASLLSKRLVALAGPTMDAALAVLLYGVWGNSRGDWPRLILWYCWLCCGFEAAGYMMFSGLLGLGDLGPTGDGGLAPVSHPLLWQIGLAVIGVITYVALVGAGQRTLTGMIGPGLATRNTRRKIAHGFYLAYVVAAIVASLPNPHGLDIILTSALASSGGAIAGLINIGFGARGTGSGSPFHIKRSLMLVAGGLVITGIFATTLGPTIKL